jgi:cephalosporin hydroxylase
MFIDKITKTNTNIFGLKFKPTLSPYFSDDSDYIPGQKTCCVEITSRAFNKLSEITKETNFIDGCIVEIGVFRNGDGSFTRAILNNKNKEKKYIGIDIDDRSYLNDINNNIYTLKCNSHDQSNIRKYLKLLNERNISLLMIDGWHSVNTAINDWMYSDLLTTGGVVVIHDSNSHPGPICLYEAIDENVFDKHKYFTEYDDDYGIAVAKLK